MFRTGCCCEAAWLALCVPLILHTLFLDISTSPPSFLLLFIFSSLWPTHTLSPRSSDTWACDRGQKVLGSPGCSLPPTELVAIWLWYRSKTRKKTKYRLESVYSGSTQMLDTQHTAISLTDRMSDLWLQPLSQALKQIPSNLGLKHHLRQDTISDFSCWASLRTIDNLLTNFTNRRSESLQGATRLSTTQVLF